MEQAFQYQLSEDRIIRGNFHRSKSDEPEATVIVSHGFKGFKDWGMFPYAADRLSETMDVIRFNFSRCGVGEAGTEFDELEKFGRQTFSGDLEDLRDVLLRIREGRLPLEGRGPGSKNIVLLGHSRGGGESIVLALDEPTAVQGVVSWNGSTRFGSIFGEELLRTMREQGVAYIENARTRQKMPLELVIAEDLETNRDRFDIAGRIGGLKVPLTIIQGTNDYPGLIQGTERVAAANRSVRRVVIEGGDHTFGAKHPFQGTTEPLEAALSATVQAIRGMIV